MALQRCLLTFILLHLSIYGLFLKSLPIQRTRQYSSLLLSKKSVKRYCAFKEGALLHVVNLTSRSSLPGRSES